MGCGQAKGFHSSVGEAECPAQEGPQARQEWQAVKAPREQSWEVFPEGQQRIPSEATSRPSAKRPSGISQVFEMGSSSPAKGLVGATLCFFAGVSSVIALAATSEKLRVRFEEVGISQGLFGVLLAIPNLTGSLLRIPFAAWTDVGGGRRPMLVCMLLSCAGLLGMTWVGFRAYPDLTPGHFKLMLGLGALTGCGTATFSPGVAQTSYWFPESQQGWALGLFGGLGNLAPGVFSVLMAWLLSVTDSDRTLGPAYLAWFAILATGTLVYACIGCDAWYFQLRKKGMEHDKAVRVAMRMGQEKFPSGRLVESLGKTAGMLRVWLLVGLYFSSFGGMIGLAAWFPTYWSAYHETGSINGLEVALLLNAAYVIVYALSRASTGHLSDICGGILVALLGICVTLIGTGLLMTATASLHQAVLGMLFMAVGMGTQSAAIYQLVPQVAPSCVGGTAGWVGGFGAFGGFVIPPVMGRVVDTMGDPGYPAGFAVFAALCGACLAFLVVFKLLTVRAERRARLAEPLLASAA